MVSRTPRAEVSGLLSNQGEKRYKLLFHNGSFKRKKYKLVFHNGSFKRKKVLKYGTPKPSYSTLIETLIDPFKEP